MSGTPPSLEQLRGRREEIERIATRHGAENVRVFGSVVPGDAGTASELDLLVDMGDGASLFKQAALQGELEDVLRCSVHLTTTSGLRYASEDARTRIEDESVPL